MFNFGGVAFLHFGTYAASSQALREALKLLNLDVLDYAFVGGVPCKVDPLSLWFNKDWSFSSNFWWWKKISRPFTKVDMDLLCQKGVCLFIRKRRM